MRILKGREHPESPNFVLKGPTCIMHGIAQNRLPVSTSKASLHCFLLCTHVDIVPSDPPCTQGLKVGEDKGEAVPSLTASWCQMHQGGMQRRIPLAFESPECPFVLLVHGLCSVQHRRAGHPFHQQCATL